MRGNRPCIYKTWSEENKNFYSFQSLSASAECDIQYICLSFDIFTRFKPVLTDKPSKIIFISGSKEGKQPDFYFLSFTASFQNADFFFKIKK